MPKSTAPTPSPHLVCIVPSDVVAIVLVYGSHQLLVEARRWREELKESAFLGFLACTNHVLHACSLVKGEAWCVVCVQARWGGRFAWLLRMCGLFLVFVFCVVGVGSVLVACCMISISNCIHTAEHVLVAPLRSNSTSNAG